MYDTDDSDGIEDGVFDNIVGESVIEGWTLGESLGLNNPKPHSIVFSPSCTSKQIVRPVSGLIVLFSLVLMNPLVPSSLVLLPYTRCSAGTCVAVP